MKNKNNNNNNNFDDRDARGENALVLFYLQTYVVECAGVGGVPAPDLRASVGPRIVEGLDLEESLGVEEMQLESIEDGGDGLVST